MSTNTTNHNVTPLPVGTLVAIQTTNGGRAFGALTEPHTRIGRPYGCGWVHLVIRSAEGNIVPTMIDAGRIASLDIVR